MKITTAPDALDRRIKAEACLAGVSASAWATQVIGTLLSDRWQADMDIIRATMDNISTTAEELQDPSAPGRIALDVDLDALAEALTRVTELGGA